MPKDWKPSRIWFLRTEKTKQRVKELEEIELERLRAEWDAMYPEIPDPCEPGSPFKCDCGYG